MPAPLLDPARVAAELGRPLDAAEREALTALEGGRPLAAPDGAAPPWASAPQPAPELPEADDLEGVLLALLALPRGEGADARAEVVEAAPGVALALARGGAAARLDPSRGGEGAALEAARWLACRGAAPECAAASFERRRQGGVLAAGSEAAGAALSGARLACAALRLPLTVPAGQPELAGAADAGSLVVALAGRSAVGAAATFPGGEVIALVGAVGGGAPLGGSAYARRVHGEVGGAVPRPELLRERAVLEVVRRAVGAGIVSSARPVGRGGLAVALAEGCGAAGAAVRVPFAWPRDRVLFGEEPGRVLVSLPAAALPALAALAEEHRAPLIRLGVAGGERLEVQAALSVELDLVLAARRAAEGPAEAGPRA